jgi:hypothetical protein
MSRNVIFISAAMNLLAVTVVTFFEGGGGK